MFPFFRKLVLFILAVISFAACQDDPSTIGSNLIPDGDNVGYGQLDSFVDTVQQSSSFYTASKDTLFLGASTTLLLGKYKDIKSSMLMRFYFSLPDTISTLVNNNNFNIISTTVSMKKTYLVGNEHAAFDFSVYPINDEWSSSSFYKENLQTLNYDRTNLASDISETDTTVNFVMEKNTVIKWLKNAAGDSTIINYGVLFSPSEGSQKIVGFNAYAYVADSLQPTLTIIGEEPDGLRDTLLTYPTLDIHVVEGSVSDIGDERIAVQGGLGVRSIVTFDLSKIKKEYIINSATLELIEDGALSYSGIPSYDSVSVNIYANAEHDSINSDYGTVYLAKTGGKFQGDVTYFVQSWLYGINNDGIKNYGFRISDFNEAENVDRHVFYSSNSSEPSIRPRLKITYTKR